MRYYPILLDIKDRSCLVVGGGRVGTRKVGTLLKCGARVTVVSREFTDHLFSLNTDGKIALRRGGYESADLDGMFMVIGATDDMILNQKIHDDAEQRNMLCNIADKPDVCNFILPSIVHRGDLILAISTSGKSPAFAKSLRKRLGKQFGEEYDVFLTLMGKIREKLLGQAHEPEAHKPLFEALIDGGMLELIGAGDTAGIDGLLARVLGGEYRFNDLMNPLTVSGFPDKQ
ncbi:MAG: bifunctional precorrin-2 dehydrogenase/sirohydrochlorin ferrochelatase [Desulfobacteraceae bacterium]|nr:bifunctional precorrin-2 dehydrogenase/sirohydrochlorin ferrochelatase [Desulfobacteraceae bacterium]